MSWTVDGLVFNTRKELTIDSTLIDADLDNFVVEAMRTDDGDIGADATANGGDIRFTLKVGGTLLTYERELWSLAGGLATFVHHVKVPAVPSAADTVLYCYYNTSTGSPPDGDDGLNGNTWESALVGVWHHKEAAGGAGAVKDSSGNANHGTDSGSPTFGAAGKVNGAINFDGTNDYVDAGAGASLDIDVNPITLEAWVKPNGITAVNADIVGRGPSATNGFGVLQNLATIRLGFHGGGNFSTGNVLSAGTWTHVAGVINGASSVIYINGSSSATGSVNVTASTASVVIGGEPAGALFLPGIIDEVRISNIARPAAWIKASYNSQNGSLITWGAEEVSAAGQHRSTIKWFTA